MNAQTSEPTTDAGKQLDELHHVAISVADVAAAVEWYTQTFRCNILYLDDTWAFLEFANCRLALVVPHQHPPHIAFSHEQAGQFGDLKPHRDGTRSVYISDPSNNAVEIMDASSL